MLFPTHVVTVTRPGVSAPLATNRAVRIVAPPPEKAVTPMGQPVPTLLQDNGPLPPAYARGDIVTILSRVGSTALPAVTQYRVGFVDSKGDLFPYVEAELTGEGR